MPSCLRYADYIGDFVCCCATCFRSTVDCKDVPTEIEDRKTMMCDWWFVSLENYDNYMNSL
jgi:hypothetical protein